MSIIPATDKVYMVREDVNTNYGGSEALKPLQNWYTMQDVIDTVGSISYSGGLYSQIANSTPVTGTTTESSLIGTGVGSLFIPANVFQIGDTFRAIFSGVMNAANNQTIRIRVKAGSVTLLDSGVQSLTNSIVNDIFTLNLDFTIRQLGVPGVASIASIGSFHYVKTSNASPQGFAFNIVNNTTFNTTISNILNVTVEWGSADNGNSIYSDIFVLNKTY